VEPNTAPEEPLVAPESISEVTPEIAPEVVSESAPFEPTPFAPQAPPVDLAAEQASVVATTPKKSKKPLIIGLIVAAVIVLLGGGSVLAYNVWYQNPEKVVTDALMNAATAKTSTYVGNLKVEGNDVKTVIDLTTKQSAATGSLDAKVTMTLAGKDYTVNGSALFDGSGDLYFKVEKLASIAAEYKTQFGLLEASQSSLIDKLVAKIDGTWVKVSSADLKDYSATTATATTCVTDAVKKFKDDKAATSEITNLYQKNPFIVIDKKLGEKDGSFGYTIKSDIAKTKAFAEGLKTTKIYTAIHDCDNSFTIDTSSITDSKTASTGSTEVWVSRWSHQFTKLTVSDTSEGTTTTGMLTPTYNQPVEVATPASSTTLKQLQSDVEAVIQSAYSTSLNY
jgi:hypothetical protein